MNTAVLRTRSRRVGLLVSGIIALSLADLALTIHTASTAGLYEANPIARFVIEQSDGPIGLIAFKIASVGFVAAVLFGLRRRRSAEFGAVLSFFILAWVSITWIRYLSIMSGIDPVMLDASDPQLMRL
jgi:hypothetical protein